MPGHSWSRDSQAAARRINAVNPDAQARLSFAIECVNGLHYLVDLDEYLVPNDVATDVLNHNWQVVDMAHVRWAAGSAITALDLCAAALGRLYCGIVGNERDLSVESAKQKHWTALRKARGGEPSKWITAVRGDHRCQDLLRLRHELTHRVRPRSYSFHMADAVAVSDFASVGPPSPESLRAHAEAHAKAQAEAEERAAAATYTDRTGFTLTGRVLTVPMVLRLARDVATEHVEAFVTVDWT
jgi:hypothetical protein